MITSIILTHNESGNIERCIASLQWADEVLVVDDNSNDGTATVARKTGARVVKRALNGDFASQRNFAIDQAKNSWIFFVDADEVVSEELAKEVMEAINNIEYKGFRVRRFDHLWGRELSHGDIGRFNYIRLGRRGAGEWHRRVDEIWGIEGKVGQLKHPLQHFPHQTLTEFLEEINFKSTLNARVFYEQGTKTTFWNWGKPLATFLRSWIFTGGWRDGMPGFNISLLMSLHSFLVRSKLYLLEKQSGKSNNVNSSE
jgi:glycosyltransferase involved in cell wall biosynthesis